MLKPLAAVLVLCTVPAVFAQSAPVVQTATVTLTSAQLMALSSTPVQVVAAPGAGHVIVPINATMQYKFGSIAYKVAPSNRLSLSWLASEDIGDAVELLSLGEAGLFDRTTNAFSAFAPSPTPMAQADAQSNVENQPLVIVLGGGIDMTNGDGTGVLTVNYTIVALQ